jgi:hypothetical protein
MSQPLIDTDTFSELQDNAGADFVAARSASVCPWPSRSR